MSKVLKILMAILNWEVNSFSNFAFFLIVIADNSSVSFKFTYFLLCIKGSNESPNFETFERALVKIFEISHVIFENTSQFSFEFCINIQYHQT